MKLQINFIFRKRLPQYNSIEELFGTISQSLSQTITVNQQELPRSGASLSALIQNLRSLKIQSNCIYHITGDVNYTGIRLGKRAVLTVHDVKSALRGSWLKKRLILWLWFQWPASRVQFVTVISEFSRTELSKIIPRHRNKIRVIPNPLNSKIVPHLKHNFNSQEPHILLIGTKPNKNLERSIEALTKLSCKLLIIGKLSGPQKNLLKHYQLNYENHVHLTFKEIVKLYQKSDLLCFPSTYEGFGMPIIEAQGTGRPVLTSNLGAMKEVAGEAALLVDPFDVNAIRSGVLRLLEDAELRQQLVKNGLENIKRFQLERITQQYLELYKQMSC